MKTKAQIVQELLEKDQITAEDAVVLLMGSAKEKEYIYVPQPYPFIPHNPYPYDPIIYRSGRTTDRIIFDGITSVGQSSVDMIVNPNSSITSKMDVPSTFTINQN